MSLTKQGRVEGSSIVFSSPLPLSDGTQVTVQIETVPPSAAVPPASPADLATFPFFGMWSGREDMEDAAAWVREERAAWPQRAAHEGREGTRV